jgi:N-formylglutamate amidohydrolase
MKKRHVNKWDLIELIKKIKKNDFNNYHKDKRVKLAAVDHKAGLTVLIDAKSAQNYIKVITAGKKAWRFDGPKHDDVFVIAV